MKNEVDDAYHFLRDVTAARFYIYEKFSMPVDAHAKLVSLAQVANEWTPVNLERLLKPSQPTDEIIKFFPENLKYVCLMNLERTARRGELKSKIF